MVKGPGKSVRTPQNRPPPVSTDNSNLLLAALPQNEYSRILPRLDVIPLKLKEFLHKSGDRVKYVYFPASGFCSELTVLEDGTMVEVATIGREGMVGVAAAMDGGQVRSTTMVQAAGDACYRMTAEEFRREMERREAFYDLITHFAQAMVGFIMQSTACNAVHTVEQRLARWLLMAQDRIGHNDFPLTQEFAAMMLGVSRPTVTVVAGTLQKAGLITYHRGHVTIVDREALEQASCECYRVATELLRRVTDGRPRC
jgi:CRP-like cAMP-binding protein